MALAPPEKDGGAIPKNLKKIIKEERVMGQEITKKVIKGKVVSKHETQGVWDNTTEGSQVQYKPERGETVFYDPDVNCSWTRIKFGDGEHVVRELPFAVIGRQESVNSGEVFNSSTNVASGQYSHAEGYGTKAIGINSHTEGYNTTASNNNAHAEGAATKATGISTHAEGTFSEATNDNAHAEGYDTRATGKNAHAEGGATEASGDNSHAEGSFTKAIGKYSHAAGSKAEAQGDYSFAHGIRSKAMVKNAYALGADTAARGIHSVALGNETEAIGNESMATGYQTKTKGIHSFAMGAVNQANGENSYAGGYNTLSGVFSLNDNFEEITTIRVSRGARPELEVNMNDAVLLGTGASIGELIQISLISKRDGYKSRDVDVGVITNIENNILFFENGPVVLTEAEADSDYFNHIIKIKKFACKQKSMFAHGTGLKATVDNQVVFGAYNEEDNEALFIVGKGIADNQRDNAFKITKDTAFIGDKEVLTADKLIYAEDDDIEALFSIE